MHEIAEPGTAAARAAREVCERFSTPALVAHCTRSWRFAHGFARVEGLEFDDELLYVTAMVHDLGLVPVFDAVEVPFETAGGSVGWVLAAGAGWPSARRDRVVEVVERHMLPSVSAEEDPEGHLLEVATGLDISGSHADVLPEDEVRAVLAAHPRLDLAAEFGRCQAAQAARKPGSQSARIVAAGLQARLDAHPLDALERRGR